ncbi:MAG: UvrD-helicase domain-containing protein, partial [Spirochaetota bacterium]
MKDVHTVSNFSEYSLEGINCIEASAGTGKTYTISHLYLRMIIEKGLGIDNILVVTFTNAATDELRSRIRLLIKVAYDMVEGRCDDEIIEKYNELYGYLNTICAKVDSGNYRQQIKDKLQVALTEIDKAHIYTIHSFCRRTLNEFAFESRSLFGSQLVEDESPYMRRIVEKFYYSEIAPRGEKFVALFYQKNEDFVSWFMKLLRKLPDDPDISILPDITFEPERLQQQICALTNKIKIIGEMFDTKFDSIKNNYSKALAEGVLNARAYNKDNILALQETIPKLSVYSALQDDINRCIKTFSISGLLSQLRGAYRNGEKHYTWHEFFTLLDESLNIILNIKIQIIAAYRKFKWYSESQYSLYRDRWNIISFKDILKDMHKALEQGPDSKLAMRVRERFKAALIDEFQDTDPLQYSIFTTIFKEKGFTLYIIGDPKQAIYSFRGADVFAYIKARESANNIYTLKKSFRSTPALTNAINYIFSRNNNPFVFNEIQYHPVESQPQDSCFDKEALQIWFIQQDGVKDKSISLGRARKIIAKNIAGEIQKIFNASHFINGKALQYSDIAILVRKHHEAELVQDVLRQYGINSVLYSRQSVFTTPEVWELLHVLEAIINPSSTAAVKRALVTSILGYSGNDIIQMEQGGILDNIKMQCATYLDVWKFKGFIVMLQRLLHDDAIVKTIEKKTNNDTIAKRLLHYNDGERVITNILHCAEILADTERQKKLDPVALVEWLKKAMYVEAEAKDQELRLESDANAVKIVTIHTSKGLQ